MPNGNFTLPDGFKIFREPAKSLIKEKLIDFYIEIFPHKNVDKETQFLLSSDFQSNSVVSEINSKIISAVIYSELPDNVTEIIDVGTIKDYRRQGFAKYLISQIPTKHGSKIFLEVSEENNIAQKLYKSTGFETVGKRKNYYNENNFPLDALIMSKIV